MRSRARCFDELLTFIMDVPMIDVHDHTIKCGPRYADAMQAVLTGGYVMMTIDGVCSAAERAFLRDASHTIEERWPLLERAWRKVRFTGFGYQARRMLEHCYGEKELTLEALKRIAGRIIQMDDPAIFESWLEKAKVVARLIDLNGFESFSQLINGSLSLPPRSLPVVNMGPFIVLHAYADIQKIMALLGREVGRFDEYLDGCRELLHQAKKRSAVAIKNAMAHKRTLEVGNPTRVEAETLFNAIAFGWPRRVLGSAEAKMLGDYLIHHVLSIARELDLPVQIHTGGSANAMLLSPLFSMYREVRFELVHANHPHDTDALALLGQNVVLDLCPVHNHDPIYCQQMMVKAISRVPHTKILGFGNDSQGSTEWDWAGAQMARENIAISLAELVEMEYLSLDDAKEIAQAWLFDNPNEFFRLGLDKAISKRNSP